MKRIALGLVVASAMAIAAPQAPATEFKGMQLGAQAVIERMKDELQLRCEERYTGKKECHGYTSIAEAETPILVTIGADGGIETIDLHVIKAAEFQQVAKALVSKYGKPQVNQRPPVRTKNGAHWTAEFLQWQRPDGSRITAGNKLHNLDNGSVRMQSANAVREETEEGRTRKATQIRDL
ncbi:MAG: hypothetical protein EOP37_03325 [Rubrivivax sp.]|nr:MAG: hypothetical protein EOP37_03325 [Rubrivivax sp.]